MPAQPNDTKRPVAIDAWKNAGLKPNSQRASLSGSATDERGPQDRSTVKCHILVVDSDQSRSQLTSGILADLNHELIEVDSTEAALLVMANRTIDLILIDLKAPEIGAIAFCEIVRKTESIRLIPIFIQATAADHDVEAQAFVVGVDEFLIAPLKPTALRARVHATLRLKSMMESLDDSESVLLSLAKSVEDRDPDLGQHCQRLALMASALGLALGLPTQAITSLQRGGYLHDIGKIGIPDRVLFKAGPLTADEWDIMRSHSERGERICACMKSMAPVLPIIRNHHEKFDGSGYPDGLKGEEIPLLARILQTVDIYDALTTERPYKRAYSSEEALTIMREETQKGWRDPFLMDVFADILPMFRHPSLVDATRLSLQALADSLDHYRRNSLRKPTLSAANFNAQKL
jgi:putative two-component system response regulator